MPGYAFRCAEFKVQIYREAYYNLFSFRKTATDSARFYGHAVGIKVSRFISRQIARIPLIFRRIVENLGSQHLLKLTFCYAICACMLKAFCRFMLKPVELNTSNAWAIPRRPRVGSTRFSCEKNDIQRPYFCSNALFSITGCSARKARNPCFGLRFSELFR